MFGAYCARRGVLKARFLFKGHDIDPDETFTTLGMRDNGIIEAQIGW